MSGKGKKGGAGAGAPVAKKGPVRRSTGQPAARSAKAKVGATGRLMNGGASRGPRLYVKGVMTSFQRSKRNQTSHTVLLKLQGVNDKAEVDFYKGKRVCYIYKAPTEKNGARFRTIWGKVTGAHGSVGGVKAKFQTNMPTKALGQPVRVMLYPSQI
jgi:large subunit ribosomal protein L35Ae